MQCLPPEMTQGSKGAASLIREHGDIQFWFTEYCNFRSFCYLL